MKKLILKLLTSGELIELLDKNGDGKIQWSEIKNASKDIWIELLVKFIVPIGAYLL